MPESEKRQKIIRIFTKFVHTDFYADVIMFIVKPPNTLYSFCYTPLEKYLLRKRQLTRLSFLCAQGGLD